MKEQQTCNFKIHTCVIFLFTGKAFSITYIRLKFQSSRPESFAIYKKTTKDSEWIPYQYYSASCEETYTRTTRDIITRDDETKPICTDEYSDISPLTGGSVAFSTLEGRPSAYNFENSPVLQVIIDQFSIWNQRWKAKNFSFYSVVFYFTLLSLRRL